MNLLRMRLKFIAAKFKTAEYLGMCSANRYGYFFPFRLFALLWLFSLLHLMSIMSVFNFTVVCDDILPNQKLQALALHPYSAFYTIIKMSNVVWLSSEQRAPNQSTINTAIALYLNKFNSLH